MSIPSLPDHPPPLVGRERELGVLRQQLAAALTGGRRLVLIGGEAGIGKTALAEAICREAQEQGALVLVGRCYDLTETPPYGPWVELFGRYRQGEGLPSLPAAFAARGAVGEVASQPVLLQRVLDFFTELAAVRPIVVLLDDLHWADIASLDLLRFLARNIETLPLLIIVAYRREEIGRDHPLYPLIPILVHESGAQRLEVRTLARAAVAAWVAGRYRLSEADTDRLVSHLAERAEGNPLFVGELLHSLEEADVLRQHDEAWVLGALTEQSVPALLRAVIDTRLARLGTESQRLLGIAAVIGAAVPYSLWMAVAVVDEGVLLTAVAEAEAAHAMIEERDGAGAAFTHALIREALYEAIRPSERRRWHRITGETLAAQSDADPDAVANHLRRAGDARAVDWLIAAGDRAARAYAWATAADRFEAALAMLGSGDSRSGERGWLLFRLAALRRWDSPQVGITMLDEAEQLASMVQDRGLLAHAVFQRGMLRCITGDLRRGVPEMEAGATARRALTVDEHAILRTLLQPLSILDDTDGQGPLSQWLATVGRFTDSREVGERALGEILGDDDNGGISLGLGQAYAGLGLPERAMAAFEHTRQASRAIGNDFQVGMNAAVEANSLLPFIADRPTEVRRLYDEMFDAWGRAATIGAVATYQFRYPHIGHLFMRGRWSEAREYAERERESPRGIQPSTKLILAPLLRAQGDADAAWELIRATLPEGSDTAPGGILFPSGLVLIRLAAELSLHVDDMAAAHAWLSAHDRWVVWSASPVGQADSALAWAAYYRRQKNISTAMRCADEAHVLARNPRQPLVSIVAYRLQGELALESRDYDGAERHLAEALALAAMCDVLYERALTLLSLAELRVARGEKDAARVLLDEARTICLPLGAQPALARIDAFMARLDAKRSPAAAYPAGLTAREGEVLRLMAAGKTNREIAATLFLSEYTVRAHVRSILTKTNTDNRTAAAAFVREYDLL